MGYMLSYRANGHNRLYRQKQAVASTASRQLLVRTTVPVKKLANTDSFSDTNKVLHCLNYA